jgi:hypothetical protein
MQSARNIADIVSFATGFLESSFFISFILTKIKILLLPSKRGNTFMVLLNPRMFLLLPATPVAP